MLETHVAQKLVGSITSRQVAELQSLFSKVPDLIKQRDLDQLLAIDRKFHQGLVTLLDNPHLDSIAEHIYDLVIRTWYLSFRSRSQKDLTFTLQDHINILNKLEQGNSEAADKAVREHVQNFRNKVFHQPRP